MFFQNVIQVLPRPSEMGEPAGKKPWCWERLKAGREGMTEDQMVGWHYWLDGHECEQTLGDGEGQGGLACCSPWGRKESDTTERLNNNKSISWKTIFPWTEVGEWLRNDSSAFYLLCSLFLLLFHQLHLWSSGIRFGNLGTPALPNQPISHNNFISIFNKSFFCDQGWLLAINYPGPHI